MAETKTSILGKLVTDAEREELRRVLATGSTMRKAAEALDRPLTTVQTMASRAGLVSWDQIPKATREGVLHFADQGWGSSRIAQRFRVPVQFVDHLIGRSGA